MTTLTYGPTPYHRLKRQQLLTLAIALEAQRALGMDAPIPHKVGGNDTPAQPETGE